MWLCCFVVVRFLTLKYLTLRKKKYLLAVLFKISLLWKVWKPMKYEMRVDEY